MSHLRIIRIFLVAAALVAVAPSFAQKAFVDVGKQPPITVLIGSTPWYPAFEKVVGAYEQQTGNQIKLDVTPFASILEKARNATRSGQSPYDLMMLDMQCRSSRSWDCGSTRR
jgi:multiple sugar transport system substrate-binding protein